MIFDVRYSPQEDYSTSLWEVVDLFRREVWRLPDHQRGAVWDKKKKIGWVKRLASPVKPVGVIVTYEITKDNLPSHTFVNDGAQRIKTTIEFLSDPSVFKYNDAEAEDIVRKCRMPIQHRWYQDHDEAFLDFQRLNQGTTLTAMEFYKGVLVYMDDYKTLWKPLFDELHSTMMRSASRVAGRRQNTRPQQHKFARHDYVLAYRFISKDTGVNRLAVGKEDISGERLERREVIEWNLRNRLVEIGIETARQEFGKICSMIERETALIETIWNSVKNEQEIGRGLSITLFRFIVDLSIWKRNNEIPNPVWSDFLTKLLINTRGAGAVIDPNDPSNKRGLALGRLDTLNSICKFIDSNISDYPIKRPARDSQTKPGYDQSHLLPISTNGPGPTVPEPASLNRSRGAKPMELDK